MGCASYIEKWLVVSDSGILKSGIPSRHQNKDTASQDSGHDAPLSALLETGCAAVPACFLSASG